MYAAFTTLPGALPTVTTRTRRAQTPMCTAAPEQAPPVRTPTHWRVPVLGAIFSMLTENTSVYQLARRFGPVYKSDFLGIPITTISDLNAIGDVYKDAKTFRCEGAYPPSVSNSFGPNSIVNVDDEAHKAKRNIIAPAFTSKLMPIYHRTIDAKVTDMWKEVAELIAEKGHIRMIDSLKVCTLNIIIELTTGGAHDISPSSREALYANMSALFLKLQDGIQSIPYTPPYRSATAARLELVGILSELYRQRLETRADFIEALRAESGDAMSGLSELRKGKLDLVTVMAAASDLPTGPGVEHDPATLDELAHLTLAVWYGGFSTQANLTTSALLVLGFDSELWGRLRDEQDAIVKAAGTKELSYDQMSQMPLMDSFLVEMARMYPPLPRVFRKVAHDTTVMGHRIPKGRLVMLDIEGAHRNPQYYPEPDVFKLDRFLKGPKGAPTPAPTIAFGVPGGAHYCVGKGLATLNQKTILSRMFREVELELDPKQNKKWHAVMESSPISGTDVIGLTHRGTASAGNPAAEKVNQHA